MPKTKTNNNLQYKYLFLLSTAYLAVDINIQGFMALMPFVQDDFGISRAQAGLYSTSYFLIATIVAIFAGNIVDKIGSKRSLVFATTSVGIIILLHSLAPNYLIILILAFFTGLCFSIITPSLNKAVMKKVTPANRATSMGIMQMGGGVGGFAGASLLPLLGGVLGWRIAVLFSGTVAILVSFILRHYLADDSPEEKEIKTDSQEELSFPEKIKLLLKNKKLLVVCLMGLGLGISTGAVPAHYTLFLTRDLAVGTALAGLCLGILQIGGIFGRPAWGWISDYLLGGSRRRGLLIVGSSISVLNLFYGLFYNSQRAPILLIIFTSFLLGMMGLGWMSIFFTTVSEIVSEKYTGIGTGFALIFLRSGVVISPPLFGLLADITGTYRLSWLLLSVVIFLFTLIFTVGSKHFNTNQRP